MAPRQTGFWVGLFRIGSIIILGLLVPCLPDRAIAEGFFIDASASTGLDFVHFNGMTGEHYLLEVNGSGVALFDYDNDGDLDVYLVQGQLAGPGKTFEDAVFPPAGPRPPSDQLLRNDLVVRADGTVAPRFVDVTQASGLRAQGYGMGVAAGDYDNDGWVDLYITNFGSNQLWRNNHDGSFSDVTAVSGTDDKRWSVAAAFFDFDQDGWLDLFVGNYVDFSFSRHRKCPLPTGAPDYCAPLAYEPEPDRLLRNRQDGTFEDVTRRAGIADAYGNALGVVTADFNADGRPDLYVANDMVPNQMWVNQGDGTFLVEGMMTGSAVNEEGHPEASMGVVAGDIDSDGDVDLFMTHLAGETNTLYINDGSGNFRDETRRRGLATASWEYTAFGTVWIDIDNDSWLDLIIANGAVTVIEALERQADPYPLHQPNQVFRNTTAGRFEEITDQAGEVFALSEVSRGLAMGDVDNDGDADVMLTNNSGPARLLLNQVGSNSSWVGLRLLDTKAGGLGAVVAVKRADQPALWRRVQTDGSYASASDARLLVGLGADAIIEWIEIRWPDGRIERRHSIPAGSFSTVIRRPNSGRS